MRSHPYPVYARLREEDPVHYSPVISSWVLTRHADVVSFFADHDVLSSDRTKAAKWKGAPSSGGRSFQADGERHASFRTLVTKAFTPRVVDGMRVRIEAIVGDLL